MHHLSITSKYKCLPAEWARHCLPIVSRPFQRACLARSGKPYIRNSSSTVSVMFFNSSSPLGNGEDRNSLSLGVTSEAHPCARCSDTRRVKVHSIQCRAWQTRMMLALLGPGQPAERWSPCWTLTTSSMMGLGMAEAVTGSVSPYAFSACRPWWILWSFKEHEAPRLAVAEPRWAVMWGCSWGTLAAILWVSEQGELRNSSSPHYSWPVVSYGPLWLLRAVPTVRSLSCWKEKSFIPKHGTSYQSLSMDALQPDASNGIS